jgi:hypothetical protein
VKSLPKIFEIPLTDQSTMNWSNGVLGYYPETITPSLQYSITPDKLEQNSQADGRKNLNLGGYPP